MKIDAQISYNKVASSQDTDAHLVLSLTAPTRSGAAGRPHICIVPVIDVSGSMSGAKLDYAKRSAIKLIEHLKPGDYCGLIVFETGVRTIVAPQRLTAETKEQIKVEIGKLRTGGSTNFSGGLLSALELLEKLDLPDGIIQRVVMFTDGEANAGVATKPDELIRLLTNAGRATVSAFGYGADVNAQFLLDFAKEGKGNYAFIENPDDALTAFGKELGGLLSTYATNLVVHLDPLADHEITSVVSDVDADQEPIGGDVTIRLSDILEEETRHLVLAIKLKAQKNAFPRAVNVFDAKLSYDIVDAMGKKNRQTLETKAKVHFVKAGEEDQTPSSELAQLISLTEIIRAQIEAEEAAKKGDFEEARKVMHVAAARSRRRGGAGQEQIAHLAQEIGDRIGSHEALVANQGYLRSVQAGVTRGMGAASYEGEANVVLDAFSAIVGGSSNSIQTDMMANFSAPSISPGEASIGPGIDNQLVPSTTIHGLFVPEVNMSSGGLIVTPTPAPMTVSSPAKKPIKKVRSSRW